MHHKLLPRLLLVLIVSALLLAGCDKDDFAVVVSDGITSNYFAGNLDEILPYATVYQMNENDKDSLLKLVTAEKVDDVEIQYYVRVMGSNSDWIRIGPEGQTLKTNSEGRVKLPGIREFLPENILSQAPVDLQLKAMAVYRDMSVEDDLGMIRVLDGDPASNPEVVASDHDNTIHRTGGANSFLDWIEFVNWIGSEWPLIDGYVTSAIEGILENGRDMVVVSGLPADLRNLCRHQMMIHFGGEPHRRIPIFVKQDLDFEHGNEFKENALGIIKDLYGDGRLVAMVGDTVREDGYGALANGINYIPYQVDYYLDSSLLDTEGFGLITPDDISWDWLDVVERINGRDISSNLFLQAQDSTWNIAHRGGGELDPENTIVAYYTSLAAGADVLEMDVHLTSDGFVVVSHDDTVDRCTDGSGAISGFTLDELKAFNAGYNFTPDGNTYPYREAGEALEIPTLREVFAEFSQDDFGFVLEIKPENNEAVTEKVLDLIVEFGMEDRVVLGAFGKSSLDMARIRAAVRNINVMTSFATEEVVEFLALPESALELNKHKPKGNILQIPLADIPLIPEYIMDKSESLGLKVQVWTVNDPGDMRWLAQDLQVDGIMTDNPETLEEVLSTIP